jgi:hypothetical protein
VGATASTCLTYHSNNNPKHQLHNRDIRTTLVIITNKTKMVIITIVEATTIIITTATITIMVTDGITTIMGIIIGMVGTAEAMVTVTIIGISKCKKCKDYGTTTKIIKRKRSRMMLKWKIISNRVISHQRTFRIQ